jgi:hypothetical protein
MKVGDTDGRLILSHRDAVTLNFKPYSDDRTRGVVANLTLNLKDDFVLIPAVAVKLGAVSTFPKSTNQHDLVRKGDALFYQSKNDGKPEDMEGVAWLQVLRYSPKEMGRAIGHLLGCRVLNPSSICCAPNKHICVQIWDGPVRGTVRTYSGHACQTDMLVDRASWTWGWARWRRQ